MRNLNDVRSIEKMFFPNPKININDYPALDQIDKEYLEEEILKFNFSYWILCIPFLRFMDEEDNYSWYLDVYLSYACDSLDDNFPKKNRGYIKTERLVISPGYELTEQQEKLLYNIQNLECVMFNEFTLDSIVKKINELSPELHLESYIALGDALCHVYFASMRCGVRELLYKANLGKIALRLDDINEYNIIANNIDDIFGLPLNLLRKLNHNSAIEKVLCNQEERAVAKEVYNCASSIMNTLDKVGYYQLKYLRDCFLEKTRKFKRRILSLLWDLDVYDNAYDPFDYDEEFTSADEIYEKFFEYQDLLHEMGLYKKNSQFPLYPPLCCEGDINRFISIYNLLKQCKIPEYRELIAEACSDLGRYEYEGEKYQVICPHCIEDIIFEANQQKNCLLTMVDDIAFQETIILFMRNKSQKNKSLVTLETDGDVIVEAKGFANRELTKEEENFLKEYTSVKNMELYGLVKIKEYADGDYMKIPDAIDENAPWVIA